MRTDLERLVEEILSATIPIERFALSISSRRRELYVISHNGNRLLVLDLNGAKIDEHGLAGGNVIHAIGAGRRGILWP